MMLEHRPTTFGPRDTSRVFLFFFFFFTMCQVYRSIILVLSHFLKDVSGTDVIGYWATLGILYVVGVRAVIYL